MRSRPNKLPVFRLCCLAAALVLALFPTMGQSSISSKISGGFQAPTTDADGRRHVVRGTDAEARGNGMLELTQPRVTRYNADNTPDMFIESAQCSYNTKAGLAYSSTNLVVRTADGRFAIEGVGWSWNLADSLLAISNNVVALVQKASLSGDAASAAVRATNTVKITSHRFQQEGDAASFLGHARVEDGEDMLSCEKLNIEFARPGGARKIEASGQVELIQPSTRIRSGHAIYDVKENLLRISEHPEWLVDKREGSANLLIIDRAKDVMRAEGDVFMKLSLTNFMASAEGSRTNQNRTNSVIEIRSDNFDYVNARSNRLAEARYQGHVRAVQADSSVTCAELVAHFSSSNKLTRLVANNEVQISSPRENISGKKADYDLESDKIVIEGAPKWQIDRMSGRSESLVFSPRTKEVLARQNVEMIVPGRSLGNVLAMNAAAAAPAATNGPLKITSELLRHAGSLSVFERQVHLADARGTIDCEKLTVITGQSNQVQRILAEGQVAVKQPDFTVRGERAEYDQATGLVRLTGHPELVGPDKTLFAESFLIDRNRNTFSVSPGKYRIHLRLPKHIGSPAE